MVTLPSFVTYEVAEHLRRFPPAAEGLVFTAERGGPAARAVKALRDPMTWGNGSSPNGVRTIGCDLRKQAIRLVGTGGQP